MSEPIIIPTENPEITVCSVTFEDAEDYYHAVNQNRAFVDASGGARAPHYESVADVYEAISQPLTEDMTHFVIRSCSVFAGSLTLVDRGEAIEIGYWLVEDQTGKGIATIALRAASNYVKELSRWVFCEVRPQNHASIRVLERAGFLFTLEAEDKLIFEFR